ncbi:MAG: hypothetical protein K8S97_00455 [Anaerolineae bacterium]|nr:hypothetical protein [Anaerolineae bacterium]
MNTRPAWGLLIFGALIIIGLFLSPIWLQQFEGYIKEAEEISPFPDAFYNLPSQAQDIYIDLYDHTSPQMAIDLVAARLVPDVDIEEPNMPAIDPNPQLVEEALTGNFVRMDAARSAIGTASIYRLSDGRTIVRLQNLDAINGPEMRVLLTAFPSPSTREDLNQTLQYEIDLGALKGNLGNQNYEITDPTFNIDNYTEGSIVLYSARYELIFSFAPLSPPEQIPGT